MLLRQRLLLCCLLLLWLHLCYLIEHVLKSLHLHGIALAPRNSGAAISKHRILQGIAQISKKLYRAVIKGYLCIAGLESRRRFCQGPGAKGLNVTTAALSQNSHDLSVALGSSLSRLLIYSLINNEPSRFCVSAMYAHSPYITASSRGQKK